MNPRDINRRLKEHKTELGWTERRGSSFRHKKIGTDKSAVRLDKAMFKSFNSQLELILENEMDLEIHGELVSTLKDGLAYHGNKGHSTALKKITENCNLSATETELIGTCIEVYQSIPIGYIRPTSFVDWGSGRERMKNLWPEKYHVHFETGEGE